MDKKICNHTGWIRCLIQLKGGTDDGKIASASDDLTIRIFSLNGDFERIINGHASTVTAIIQLSDARLASSSWDKTVRVWNMSSYQTELILTGHSKGVYCLTQLKDDRLVTGSSDFTIKIYS
jgi:WD40 repeat protein